MNVHYEDCHIDARFARRPVPKSSDFCESLGGWQRGTTEWGNMFRTTLTKLSWFCCRFDRRAVGWLNIRVFRTVIGY
jgi:hypothetical protein